MESEEIALLLVIALPIALVLLAALVWYLRRRRATLKHALKGRTWGQAKDVVIPDGMDAHVHLDCVILTRRGLVVLDIKRLNGAVFGSERMEEWVMLDRGKRFGFRNPLGALDERVSALANFVGGIRVEGYILVSGNVEFPKGRPARTLVADDLIDKLEPVEGGIPDGWKAMWGKVAGHAE
ncbi:nuclease-related domain-containing protein [Natronospira bacteriovora]|uniref:Nuclease-related domain-containing protein n=1 Tax=Natronospira bacteriovora TaxID=3069753 RepID=A0ABU0W9F6_9GAMM|nr:nuclease-related domain-containing protein [Natronospira sp. AB-CW4]MDQ2070674.1 nuclease-related domain-containing protein [Natronospira sp. AB-CW4]